MHLQQHAAFQPGRIQRRRQLDHGALDDVGRPSLQRCIAGLPLGIAALGGVAVGNAGHPATAAERGQHETADARFLPRAFHVRADARVAHEIRVDIALRLARLDAELAAEPEGADAIDDAEIDRLGAAPDQPRHLRHRHAEHLARRAAVDVLPGGERLAQCGYVGHMGEQPQFDLGVVGTDQQVAGCGDEGSADASALLRSDRDVLQVGIVGGQASGCRGGHGERRVHPAGGAVDFGDQRVGVGGFQLGELAPFQDAARQFRPALGELLQDGGVRAPGAAAGAPAAGQLHLVEQDLAQHLRAAEVERPARQRVDIGFCRGHPLAEIGGQAAQLLLVHHHAGPLHVGQHGNQAAFHLLIQGGRLRVGQAGAEQVA